MALVPASPTAPAAPRSFVQRALARVSTSLKAPSAALALPRGFLDYPAPGLPMRGVPEHGARYFWGGAWRPQATFDYGKAVGNGLESSIVVACLAVLGDAFGEAPPIVQRADTDGTKKTVATHPLTALLRRPNPFMTWDLLAKWLVLSQQVYGEAYFWKQRNNGNKVIGLWPIHPDHIKPWWPETPDNTVWIDHFRYAPNGQPIPLPVEDVLFLPENIDPDNPRRGRSKLRALFAEIFTDLECSAWLAALLRNGAGPSVILAPDPTAGEGIDDVQAEAIKQKFTSRFGGDNRGAPMVVNGPMQVTPVSFTPTEMNLEQLRVLPESRVCAVLGVPAIVANLYVGMEHATYNNTKGLREHFAEQRMVPYWRMVANQLTLALLPDFDGDPRDSVVFDLTEVRALQEDLDARYKRMTGAVGGGWAMVNDARREVGLPEVPGGDLFYVPVRVAPTNGEQLGTLPAMVSPARFGEPVPAAAEPVPAAGSAAPASTRSSASAARAVA